MFSVTSEQFVAAQGLPAPKAQAWPAFLSVLGRRGAAAATAGAGWPTPPRPKRKNPTISRRWSARKAASIAAGREHTATPRSRTAWGRPWVSVGPCPAAGCRRACGGGQRALLAGTEGETRRRAAPWRRRRAARATNGRPSLRSPRPPCPPSRSAPPRPVPSPPGSGARGTHRVRIGAEVLEGEGAEDEAREQGRRALALHAPNNGGPRRGGGSPQRPPAAGQGRARWGTSPPVRARQRREEAACGARAAACPGPLRRRGAGSPQPPALPTLRQASPPPSLSRPLPASCPARLAAKPALNGVILLSELLVWFFFFLPLRWNNAPV